MTSSVNFKIQTHYLGAIILSILIVKYRTSYLTKVFLPEFYLMYPGANSTEGFNPKDS